MAGVYSRKRDRSLDQGWTKALEAALSPAPGDVFNTTGDSRFIFAKKDLKAYGTSAFASSMGTASMLVGDPILRESDGGTGERGGDLAKLASSLAAGEDRMLRAANGVYALAHYDGASQTLSLASDKLGIRPVYVWEGENEIVFSTALKVLERLRSVPKIMSLRGTNETVVFGFALSDRTPYRGIRVMKAGELSRFSEQGDRHSRYWRWDDVKPRTGKREDLTQAAYDAFSSAVKRRSGSDKISLAFLSGGLDSRCIATVLAKQLGITLYTFNMAPFRTQDQYYGELFAKALGTRHFDAPLPPGTTPKFGLMLHRAISKIEQTAPTHLDRPHLAWSGDGGSVTAGHVYLDERLVSLLREGKRDEAIGYFLKSNNAGLLPRLFPKNLYRKIAGSLESAIREELEDIRCDDPGRGFHIFLMLNDQHRHLHGHFEEIDAHGMEFHLPFYDGDFVEVMLSLPLDWCLYHKFYSDWMEKFPAVFKTAPWQTYPGHDPCPLKVGENLQDQWVRGGAYVYSNKPKLLQQVREILSTRPFPNIMDKSYLRLVAWIYRLGLRDYAYVIELAAKYSGIWGKAEGRYVLE